MNTLRTRSVAKRVIVQFRRDHRTLGLLFVAPILIVSLLAYIMNYSGAVTSLAIVNEDAAGGSGVSAGALFVAALKSNDKLAITEMTAADADRALKDGDVKAAVILPAGLTQSLMTERRLRLQLIFEGSNPSDAPAIMQALSQTAMGAMQAIPGGQGAPALDIQTKYIYGGPQFSVFDLFAPAYLTFIVFFLVFLLTCVAFLRERMQGTLERLMSTPIGRGEIVLGYTLGFGVFAVLQSLITLLWSVYVLKVDSAGSMWLVFLVEATLAIVAVGMGIFLSIFARNELQAVQFIPLVIIPQGLLCGLLIPIESLPQWLQPLAYLMPLTYAVNALRDVMIKGYDLAQIAPQLIVLVALGVALLLLATASLRREIA